MKDIHFIAILAAVSIFLFMFGLGNMALTDPDETFYAETAKEMFSSGEWVTPTIFGSPQFEKPVLYYWLVMLSYIVFGISEFAARFPAAIFGFLGVIGIYYFGRLLFSPLCGFLSGLILATCVEYLVLARACVTDMVLTVSILFCLLFFMQAFISNKRGYYYLSAFTAALAVLTKGPIGLFIPGMVIILYFSLTREWKGFRHIPWVGCVLLFMVVALPWYFLAAKVHGSSFLSEFFGFQNVTRFMEPEHKIGSSPFFYIPIVLGGFLPWTFFLPAAIGDIYKKGKNYSPAKGYRAFLLIWFLVVFIFFSISRTKLVTYIFPLFPVMALAAGKIWEKYIGETEKNLSLDKNMRISYFSLTGIFSLGAIGLVIFMIYEYPQALPGTLAASALFISGLLVSLFFFLNKKKLNAFLAVVGSIMLLSFPLDIYILPAIAEFETSKAISQRAAELADASEPIAGESDLRRGIAFYTDRTDIPDIQNYQKQIDFFSQKKRVWGIIKRKHYEQLKRNEPGLMSEPVFQTGKKVLVTNSFSDVKK